MTDQSVTVLAAEHVGLQQAKSNKSRTQILDAAIDVLISKGYAQASTLAIQEAAGVSRGRLLHHFPSRDDLLMAAVHHLARVRIEELPQKVEWPGSDRADIRRHRYRMVDLPPAVFRRLDRVVDGSPYQRAVAQCVAAAERELGPIVRAAVDSFLGPVLTAAPRTEELYPVLLSSMRGAAMTYLIDRRDPRDDPHLPLWKTLTAEYLC